MINTNNISLISLMNDPFWFTLILVLLTLWILPWKGYALWRAVKNGHLKWFIALLILNTLAILDIFYIFFINKKDKNKDN